MMKVYGDKQSGNCYKILLVASILQKKIEWVEMDILRGDTKTKEFLEKNPNGKIPLLEFEDGRFLSESNAILNFLADASPLIPKDTYQVFGR